MKFRHFQTVMILSLVLLASCCHETREYRPRKSDQLKVTIHRYEKSLFELDRNDLRNGLNHLLDEFPYFLSGNLEDTLNMIRLRNYLEDPLISQAYQRSVKVFPDLDAIEKDFSVFFASCRHFFPSTVQPSVYTYISGFDPERSVIWSDSVLVVALDLYLGPGFDVYERLGFPLFKIRKMRREYMLPDCARTFAAGKINLAKPPAHLLDYCIREGKALYLAECLLPDCPDSLLTGYSGRQLEWIGDNENNLWALIIENNLLYEPDREKTGKFMQDGPFTTFFTQESAPRTGAYIGWQIVRSFMRKNKKVTVRELFGISDPKEILMRSGYKPGR